MKKTFICLGKNFNEIETIGNAHKLRLKNGEVIQVFTHKKKDDSLGEYWCVTDAETGLQLAGFFERASFIDYCGYQNTEKRLLEIAKEKIDYVTANASYKEKIKQRLTQVEAEHKNKASNVMLNAITTANTTIATIISFFIWFSPLAVWRRIY